MASPTDYSGLKRYYLGEDQPGSDGDTLSELIDSSGQNQDATTDSGSPKLKTDIKNGKNAILFDGASSFSVPSVTSGECTFFAVFRATTPGLLLVAGGAAQNFIALDDSINGIVVTASGHQDSFLGFHYGAWFFVVWAHDATTSKINRNGSEVPRGLLNNITNDTLTFDNIGGFASFKFAGLIAEIGFYDRKLSDVEISGLMSGWVESYGISPLVVCFGNSLFRGYLLPNPLTESIPAQLQDMLGDGFDVMNCGVDSITTATMITVAPDMIYPLLDENRPYNICLAWECTNDSYFGATEPQVIDHIKTLCENLKSNGFIVGTGTYLPRSGGITPPTFEDDRVIADAEILDPIHIGVSWDGVTDIAGDVRLNNPNGTLLHTTDGTHLDATGAEYGAEDFYNGVLALIPSPPSSIAISGFGAFSAFSGFGGFQ